MYLLYDFLISLWVSDGFIDFLVTPYYIGLTELYDLFDYFGLPEYSKELIDSNSYIRWFLNTVVYAFYNSWIWYSASSWWITWFIAIIWEFIWIFIWSFLIFLLTSIFEYFFKTPKVIKSHLWKNLIIYWIFLKIIPFFWLFSSFFVALSDKTFFQKLKYIFFWCVFNLVLNEIYLNTNIFSMWILSELPIVLKAILLFLIFSLIFSFFKKYLYFSL